MKILVIGSGGREHAICAAFAKSSRVSHIFWAPGNAGIAEVAECVPIRHDEVERLADFAAEKGIDLAFAGGETPLALGIADEFARRGLRLVGPEKAAARLEASKSFAKDLMKRHGVPTARYFTARSRQEAAEKLAEGVFGDETGPVVVKADGLAAGKGVVVAKDRNEALKAISELDSIAGKEAATTIVLEECLVGREVSLLLFADGENFALMPPARDHKRIGEGDTGPNTGGMGTFTDDALLGETQTRKIVEDIVRPTLAGCSAEGFPFKGVLFLGLMIGRPAGQPEAEETPYVIEYNVRFGDPETQSILVRLETDLVDICEAILSGTLGGVDIKWQPGSSATIVLAAEGYPEKPRTGDVITGIGPAAASEGVSIFHAGTARDAEGRLITAGGRVIGVTALAENLNAALEKAYAAAAKISWKGMQFRRDIGS